jgi:hypothetical protein
MQTALEWRVGYMKAVTTGLASGTSFMAGLWGKPEAIIYRKIQLLFVLLPYIN